MMRWDNRDVRDGNSIKQHAGSSRNDKSGATMMLWGSFDERDGSSCKHHATSSSSARKRSRDADPNARHGGPACPRKRANRAQGKQEAQPAAADEFCVQECGKAFQRPSDLTVHAQVHTGEGPFRCYACGSAFAQSSALTKQLRVHSGDKPCSCDTCGKAFATSSGLAEHVRTRTNAS
jgi:uncharacterized Zn-finger protein